MAFDHANLDEISFETGGEASAVVQTCRPGRSVRDRRDGTRQVPTVDVVGQLEDCWKKARGDVVGRHNVEQVAFGQFNRRDVVGRRLSADEVGTAHQDGEAVLPASLSRGDRRGELGNRTSEIFRLLNMREGFVIVAGQRHPVLDGPARNRRALSGPYGLDACRSRT